MYNDIYDKFRDIDERDFFDKDGYLWILFDEIDNVGILNGGVDDLFVYSEF